MRFYQEFLDAKKIKTAGTCLAVFNENGVFWLRQTTTLLLVAYSGLAGIYSTPNSPVASTMITQKHLRRRCRRITREKAAQIHPALIERIRQDEEATTND